MPITTGLTGHTQTELMTGTPAALHHLQSKTLILLHYYISPITLLLTTEIILVLEPTMLYNDTMKITHMKI